MNNINEGKSVCVMRMNQDYTMDGQYELWWYLWRDMETSNEGIK